MLSLVQTTASARRVVMLDRPKLAEAWLLDSGICGPDFGVSEQYQTNGRAYTPVSKKATADYVRTLLWLFETRSETRYIDRALTVAQYLCLCTADMDGPAVLGADASYGRSSHSQFDEYSAVVRALVESWEASRHSEFLTKAIECVDVMQRIPGLCPLEAARGWLELARVTGDAQWQTFYDRSFAGRLGSYRRLVEPGDERILSFSARTKVTTPAPADSLTHQCRFLEALLAHLMGPRSQSREALRIFESVFARTTHSVHALDEETVSEDTAPTEVYARLLRLRLHAAGLGLVKLDVGQAESEAETIREMQADQSDPRIRGGFYSVRPLNIFTRVVGLTATMASLQALEQWQQYQDNCFRPALLQLI
jgi:hypothetical protein